MVLPDVRLEVIYKLRHILRFLIPLKVPNISAARFYILENDVADCVVFDLVFGNQIIDLHVMNLTIINDTDAGFMIDSVVALLISLPLGSFLISFLHFLLRFHVDLDDAASFLDHVSVKFYLS